MNEKSAAGEAPGNGRGRGPRFQQVATRRLFEEVCDQIRAELAAGTLRPGDKLPAERDLAERFGVSRLVVREALRSLEVSGVVALRKGVKGGAFIQEGRPERINQTIRDLFHLGRLSLADLMEARVMVMQMVVPLACRRATEEDFAALGKNVAQTAGVVGDPLHEERIAHHCEFYRLIAACTRNDVLQMLVEIVTDIVLQELMRIGPEPLAELDRDRRRFFQHFRARDAQAATRQLVGHLKRLQRHLAT